MRVKKEKERVLDCVGARSLGEEQLSCPWPSMAVIADSMSSTTAWWMERKDHGRVSDKPRRHAAQPQDRVVHAVIQYMGCSLEWPPVSFFQQPRRRSRRGLQQTREVLVYLSGCWSRTPTLNKRKLVYSRSDVGVCVCHRTVSFP